MASVNVFRGWWMARHPSPSQCHNVSILPETDLNCPLVETNAQPCCHYLGNPRTKCEVAWRGSCCPGVVLTTRITRSPAGTGASSASSGPTAACWARCGGPGAGRRARCPCRVPAAPPTGSPSACSPRNPGTTGPAQGLDRHKERWGVREWNRDWYGQKVTNE